MTADRFADSDWRRRFCGSIESHAAALPWQRAPTEASLHRISGGLHAGLWWLTFVIERVGSKTYETRQQELVKKNICFICGLHL